MKKPVHEQIRSNLQSPEKLGRNVNAIVLGVDVWNDLKDEIGSARGFLDWFISFEPGKDPNMYGHRILISNVIGEISII